MMHFTGSLPRSIRTASAACALCAALALTGCETDNDIDSLDDLDEDMSDTRSDDPNWDFNSGRAPDHDNTVGGTPSGTGNANPNIGKNPMSPHTPPPAPGDTPNPQSPPTPSTPDDNGGRSA